MQKDPTSREKTVLVTINDLTIGEGVVNELVRQGMNVRALDYRNIKRSNLNHWPCDWIPGNPDSEATVRDALAGVSVVYHLAETRIASSRRKLFQDNTERTIRLAEFCRKHGPDIKRFVYLSSIEVNGPGETSRPRLEGELEEPITAYGQSKLEAERRLEKFSQTGAGAFPISLVRPGFVFGRTRQSFLAGLYGMARKGVLPQFASNDPDGEKYLSLVHLDDLNFGIVMAGISPRMIQREMFFLVSDEPYRWSEITGAIAAHSGARIRHLRITSKLKNGWGLLSTAKEWFSGTPSSLNAFQVQNLEADYWVFSNERAKKILKFQPKVNLQDGLKDAVNFWEGRIDHA